MENNKNIINGNCWLACFDILGFKNEVEFADTEKYENGEYRDNFILGMCKNYSEEIKLLKEYDEFKCRLVNIIWFSDTFIFYTPNDSEECLKAIEGISRLFFRTHFTAKWHHIKEENQQNLTSKTPNPIHIPLRGCLNHGRFYADPNNNIYWGTALNKAYKSAESQNWIGYILSEEATNQIQKYHTNYWETIKDYYKKYNVPKKKQKYESLYAYYAEKKISIIPTHGAIFYPEPGRDLGEGLVWMWNNFIDKSKQYEEETIMKYENTKNFLLGIYPNLHDLVKDVGKINSL